MSARRWSVAFLFCTATLSAQSDEQFLQAAFARLDANGDGLLQKKEFPGSDRQFDAVDADRDGKATFAEYRDSSVAKTLLKARYRGQQDAHARATTAALAPTRLLWLARIDSNRDGKVTRGEWNGTDEAFLQLDLDGNGVLDRRDRAEAAALAPPPPPELPEPKGDLAPPEELLRRCDRDHDGRIAGKELATDKWLQQATAFADLDGDGALTEPELRALYDAVQSRRRDQAMGRQRPVPYDVPFEAWDQDRDGKLRLNEWPAPRDLFTAIDLDRDAAINRDEVLRYRRRVTGDDFVARFDLDGDGKVSLTEFAGPPGAFRRADRSGDGFVTRADR